MAIIRNQRPSFFSDTAGNHQVVAAGHQGFVSGLRCVGSGSSVEMYSGTSAVPANHIGGCSAGGANDGTMPTVPGHLPAFDDGLFLVVVGTVELYYQSAVQP